MISASHETMEGLVFDIDTFAIHDGPGIRMAVYLKGCPLSCDWCHSPESQGDQPELVFMHERCTLCGACVDACPNGCHAIDGNAAPGGETASSRHTIDRSRCTACGACVEACPNRALQIKGEWMTVSEIVRRAKRLQPFFKHSGGGVTLTGGEVCEQPEFACAVLEGCREAGIHTAIETSGFGDQDAIVQLADAADIVLFDLKLADEAAHRRWTGASNERILSSLAALPPDRVIVRVPLIPGITDTPENIRGVSTIAANAGVTRMQLLPYNPSAGAKYEWVGRPYEIDGDPQTPELLETLTRVAMESQVVAGVG